MRKTEERGREEETEAEAQKENKDLGEGGRMEGMGREWRLAEATEPNAELRL